MLFMCIRKMCIDYSKYITLFNPLSVNNKHAVLCE